MTGWHAREGETVVADLVAPLHTLTFPVLETILLTAVFFGGLGVVDRYEIAAALGTNAAPLRLILLGCWAVGVIWRLVVPLWRSRRRRVLVTDQRLVARPARITGRADTIGCAYIQGAARTRGGRVAVTVVGSATPIILDQVPRPKRLAQVIAAQAQHASTRVPPTAWG